jgi:hypothetical protein
MIGRAAATEVHFGRHADSSVSRRAKAERLLTTN